MAQTGFGRFYAERTLAQWNVRVRRSGLWFGNLITITFYLAAEEEDRETIEHVLDVYADGCPVARSLMGQHRDS